MNAQESRVVAEAAAMRERHFPRVLGATRHLATCNRGQWIGKRERWTNADGERWGAPCTPHCLADHQRFDALDALSAANPGLTRRQPPLLALVEEGRAS